MSALPRMPASLAAARCLVVAIVLTVLIVAPGRTMDDLGEFPMWWSPSLELDGLDRLEERLGRDFPPSEWRVFSSRDAVNPGKVIIDNCNSLLAAWAVYGGSFRDTRDLKAYENLEADCRALGMMRRGTEAQRSYLADFHFTAEALDVLPVELRGNRACSDDGWAGEGTPWNQCDKVPLIDVINRYTMVVWAGGRGLRVEILTRGDFNRDGLEDLTIKTTLLNRESDPSTNYVDFYVLTRDAAGGILRPL